ncbi:putative aconitase with swiveling domain [Bradyrhizobium sp. USDA 4341]
MDRYAKGTARNTGESYPMIALGILVAVDRDAAVILADAGEEVSTHIVYMPRSIAPTVGQRVAFEVVREPGEAPYAHRVLFIFSTPQAEPEVVRRAANG